MMLMIKGWMSKHLELGHDDHDYNCVQGQDEILDEHHLELGPGRGGKVLAVLIN